LYKAAVQRWFDRNLEGNRTTPSQNPTPGQQMRPLESELHTKYKKFLETKTKKEEGRRKCETLCNFIRKRSEWLNNTGS